MKKTRQHILFSLLSMGLAMQSYAASEPVRREFDPQKIEEYKNRSEYRYAERITFPFVEWLQGLLTKIAKWIDGWIDFGEIEGGEHIGNFIIWIMAAIVVAAIIFIIFKGNWTWLFKGKKFKKAGEKDYSVYDEDIHNINFTDEIEASVNAKNYRKATRLFYLKSLKLLSDAGHIQWQINKTNTDYRREIKSLGMREEFDYLSTTFEYVWYGEFEPTEDRFLETFDKFRRFNSRFTTQNAEA